MSIPCTIFFGTLCHLLAFCLLFQSLYPAALRVPSILHLKLSTSAQATCLLVRSLLSSRTLSDTLYARRFGDLGVRSLLW